MDQVRCRAFWNTASTDKHTLNQSGSGGEFAAGIRPRGGVFVGLLDLQVTLQCCLVVRRCVR